VTAAPKPLEAALFYAGRLGWRVFPIWWIKPDGHCACGLYNCRDEGKHPIGPCVPKGCHDATTDLDLIRAWFEAFPDANIGLATGRRSGVFVIDIDPRHGGNDGLLDLEELCGKLPDTIESLTGGGGFHYFFAYPDDETLRVGNRTNVGAPRGLQPDDPRRITGVDCRGSGGYVVVPPSNHRSGDVYEWNEDARPGKLEIAECPAEWLKLITTRSSGDELPELRGDDDNVPTSPTAERLIEQQCELLRTAGGGARHATRAEAGKRAGRLIAGGLISTGEALRRLEVAAQENSKERAWKIRKTLVDMIRIGMQWPWTEKPPGSFDGPPPPDDDDAPPESYRRDSWESGRDEPPRGRERAKREPGSDGAAAPAAAADRAPDGSEGDSGGAPPRFRVVGDDETGEPPTLDDKPEIFVNSRDLLHIVEDTWAAVHLSNDPPEYFVRGGRMIRAAVDENEDRVVITHVADRTSALAIMTRVARWRSWKQGKGDDYEKIVVRPVKDVAGDMVARPDPSLPKLEETPTAPLFDHDGTIIDSQGYHADSKVWLHFPGSFRVPAVSTNPKAADVAAAVELLQNDLLVDFPFSASSDFAHAVAGLILPFVRRMIDGPTPIHMVEAAGPGTGKSLLAGAVCQITQGHDLEAVTIGRDQEEIRKKITSMLLRAQRVIVLDNLAGTLASADLASAVTSTTWTDRELGANRMLDLPNRAVWIATANNPRLSLELARRCIRIRIVAAQDRPWEREGFKHHPIGLWIKENRPDLVRAILTLVQSWIVAGRKPCSSIFGSFEHWAATIGGILEHAAIPGFLENQAEMYEAADTATGDWRAYAVAWWQAFGAEHVTVSQLRELADNANLIPSVLGDKTEKSQATRLGKALGDMRGRILGELKICLSSDSHSKRRLYYLEPVGETPPGAPQTQTDAPAPAAGPPDDEDDQGGLF
jgi:hypothetical protein